MSNVISISGGDIRQAARALVLGGLTQLADRKNVPLTPALCEVLADGVLQRMDITALCQLAARDERGLTIMVREADAELNATVLARMWNLVALFEGGKDINDPVVRATGGTILEKFTAGLPKQGFARWPDPMQLVADHYATAPRGPIVGVAPDGTVLTRWWLGLTDLHRDPKEGPANIEQRDGRLMEEYWFKGQLHRPHEDGPAMIYTHYKNFDISGEEYFENGKLHRPSHLGPAVTHRDRKGEVVMELYVESGQHHRDPRQGPAWFHIRDARTDPKLPRPCTETKYAVRGQAHRDEQDGPAVIVRDNASGIIVDEQYWRHGKLHRDRGPAVIQRDETGKVLREHWYRDGKLHRDPKEGPASFDTALALPADDTSGPCTFIGYCVDGEHHRDEADGPASIIRHDATGTLLSEQYYRDGNPHRLGGPAGISRDPDGSVVAETWSRDGRMHRDAREGPAYFWHDGRIRVEEYRIDGARPKASERPAVVKRDASGTIIEEQYWDGQDLIVKRREPAGAEASAHG